MVEIKNTTKKAAGIIADYFGREFDDIYSAYGRPSSAKVKAWNEIKARAKETPGYNNDLKVSGAGSHNFSTIYSYTEDGKTFIIKDTKTYTYKVELA